MRRLEDFSSLFDQRIYERGEAYFDAGRVGPPEQIAPGLWHAVVRGAEDYQVDVRVRHNDVIAAACPCPYAQHAAYCKHMAAAMLAIRAVLEHGDDVAAGRSRFPREASRAVRMYAISEFPGNRTLSDDDWRAIRRIFEQLYGLPDLKKALIHEELFLLGERDRTDGQGGSTGKRPSAKEREIARLEESQAPKRRTLAQQRDDARRAKPKFGSEFGGHLANMRILASSFGVTHLDQLPHTWMTILEAAYEHLKDREGLRRLYRYYIVIAQTEAESVVVRQLRELSGPDWPGDRDEIVRFYDKQPAYNMAVPVNPAYERLLREERLGAAALRYSRWDNERLIRMLDVIANDPESAGEAEERIMTILTDPDSAVYAKDTGDYANRIGRWIRRYDDAYGYGKATALAAQIVDIFPNRTMLRSALRGYLAHGDGDATAPTIGTATGESIQNGTDDSEER